MFRPTDAGRARRPTRQLARRHVTEHREEEPPVDEEREEQGEEDASRYIALGVLHLVGQLRDDLEALERDEEHTRAEHQLERGDRRSESESPRRTRLEDGNRPEHGDQDNQQDFPQRQPTEGAEREVNAREVRGGGEREDGERDKADLQWVRPEKRRLNRGTDDLDEEDPEAEGAQRGGGDVSAPREPAAQEPARRGQRPPHPHVGAPGGIGSA